MIYRKKLIIYSNQLSFLFLNAFTNFKLEIMNFIINYMTIFFYIGIFGTVITNQIENYIEFLLPGLIILNILGAISNQTLKIWSLGSTSKLMGYWFSLPCSLEYILASFTITTIINSFMYTLPLIILAMVLNLKINIIIWFLLILLSSIFLFFINFLLVLYFFKTNSFIIIFNVSQPLLLRLSSIFYPLIYIPVFFLPFSYINPITWIVEALRDDNNSILVMAINFILDIILYKFLMMYWNKKAKIGDLI